MAETKKTVSVKPAAKAVAAKAADTKTAEVKAAAEVPAAEAKKTEKKTTAKKTEKKPAARKTTAKKATEKKETVKKAAVKETIYVQYADKDYSTENLVKIAKDVWKYDLKQKAADFKSVELYVKPEESMVYYVINGDVKGKFSI